MYSRRCGCYERRSCCNNRPPLCDIPVTQCAQIECLTVTGNFTVLGTTTLQNTVINGSATVTTLVTCNISACTPGGTITITGNVIVTGNITGASVSTCTITPCTPGGTINIQGPVNIVGTTTTTTLVTCNINACPGGTITVNGNTVFNDTVTINDLVIVGPISFCGAPLSVVTISPCPGFTTITSTAIFSSCLGLQTDNLSSCTGTINVADDMILSGNLSVCLGSVSTDNLNSCGATLTVTAATSIFSANVNICNGILRVNNITPCIPGGTITIPGNLNVTGVTGITVCAGITTNTVSGCLNNSVNFPDGLTVCNPAVLTVGTITSCPGSTTVTIDADLNVTGSISGTFDFCASGVQTNTITPCAGFTTVSVVGNLSLCPAGILSVPTISGCGAGITVNSSTTFLNNVTVCSGILTVATINDCAGAGITITGNVTIAPGSTLTACTGVITNSIESCAGNLQIVTSTEFGGNVFVCNGVLTIGAVNDCAGAGISISGNVTIIPGFTLTACTGVVTNNISSCAGNLQIITSTEFGGNVFVCNGVLTVGGINDCAGAGINISGNVTITPGNTLTVCTGVVTNSLSPCAGTLTITGPVNLTGGLNLCPGTLTVGTINDCGSGISVTGDVTIAPGSILTACTGIVTNSISSCAGNLQIVTSTVFGGNVTVCSGTLTVSGINDCGGAGINITSNVTIAPGSTLTACTGLVTDNLSSCGPTLTIVGPVNLTGGLNLCPGTLTVGVIDDCGAGISITGNVTIAVGSTLTSCTGVVTNSISSCAGNLQIVTSTVFGGNVTVCSGTLTVGGINDCGGLGINITGNVTVAVGSTLTACTGIVTDSLTSCGAILSIPPETTFGSDVNICSGTLFVNTLQGCTPAGITVIGPISFSVPPTFNLCGAPVEIGTITNCLGNPSVTVTSDLDVVGNVVISPGFTLTACTGISTNSITSCAGNLQIVTSTVFGGNVTICSGTLTISGINDCGGLGITVTSNITLAVGSTLTACTGIVTNSLSSCGGTLTIPDNTIFSTNVTVNGTFTSCTGISTNSLSACAGTLNIVGPVNITGGLSLCPGGTLTVSIIDDCGGTGITVTGNVTVAVGSTLTACTGIVTNSLSACGATLTVTDNTVFNGTVSVCAGALSVNTIQPCAPGTTILIPPANTLTVCGGIITSTISGCGVGLTINPPTTFTSTVNICSAPLTVDTIVSCDGVTNVTINPGINTPSIVATNYNLTNQNVGAGVSILGPLTGPGGNIRNFKTLTSTGGTVTITSTPTTVNFEAVAAGPTPVANVGVGPGEIYRDTTAGTINLRTLNSPDGSVQISINPSNNEVDLIVTPQSIETNSISIDNAGGTVVPPNTWTRVEYSIPTIVGTDFIYNGAYGMDSVTGRNFVNARITYDTDPAIGATEVIGRIMNNGGGTIISVGGGMRNVLVQPVVPAAFAPGFSSVFEIFARIQQILSDCHIEFWHNGTAPMTINVSGTGDPGSATPNGNFRAVKY